MKSSLKYTIACTALAVFATPLLAQVTVRRVNDRRTSGQFFAELAITMELPNVKSAEVTASRVLVTKATDDMGHDLADSSKEPRLEVNQATLMSEPPKGPVQVTLSLKNPER